MDEFFTMQQQICSILSQYIDLYQQEQVEIPVKEIRASVEELYHMTQSFRSYYCSEVLEEVDLVLERLERHIMEQNANEIVYDLKHLIFTLKNYAQLLQYMSLLFQKNQERENLTSRRFLKRYEKDQDSEKRLLAEYVKKHGSAELFNYDFADQYSASQIDIFYDENNRHYYTIYNGKRMYLSSKYQSSEAAANYIVTLYQEQDMKSPHCYQNAGFEVQEGDVVIDAGVAEGNFALDVIDLVSKIYLVECEEIWIEALKLTFAPYQDKVVFVNKFLDSKDDDCCITIDTMVGGETVNYIKMDIEGAELGALAGAAYTLEKNQNIKCNICSYHKMGDEQKIKEILSTHGFEVSTSKGYMFFKWDMNALVNMELRRGLTRGIKRV